MLDLGRRRQLLGARLPARRGGVGRRRRGGAARPPPGRDRLAVPLAARRAARTQRARMGPHHRGLAGRAQRVDARRPRRRARRDLRSVVGTTCRPLRCGRPWRECERRGPRGTRTRCSPAAWLAARLPRRSAACSCESHHDGRTALLAASRQMRRPTPSMRATVRRAAARRSQRAAGPVVAAGCDRDRRRSPARRRPGPSAIPRRRRPSTSAVSIRRPRERRQQRALPVETQDGRLPSDRLVDVQVSRRTPRTS